MEYRKILIKLLLLYRYAIFDTEKILTTNLSSAIAVSSIECSYKP